jgi:3-isopropylmalate dehydrogenase
MDAILLGAIGDPRVETGVPRRIIGGCRGKLDMYINLRPIKLYADYLCPLKDKKPEHIDMIFVRENTEDLYIGIGGHFKKGTQDEVAIAQMMMTRKGIERAVRYAYELTRKRNKRKKLTLIDKANAIGAMETGRARSPRSRGVSRHRDRPRLHRCRVHVDGEEPRVVRRGGYRQHDG